MKHNFSNIPSPQLQRSVFDRSHGHKTTFDASWLVPIFIDEVLPGDTFTMKATLFSRLATPIVPFMDNIFLDTFWFFVPHRLVWKGWESFITGVSELPVYPGSPLPASYRQISPPTYTFTLSPEIIATEPTDGSGNIVSWPSLVARLHNYLGVPICSAPQTFSALPRASYSKIWNDWFVDQNLQIGGTPVGFPWEDTYLAEDFGNYNIDTGDPGYKGLLPRGKRHDYFTSCLPWPQKGPGVEIEIGSNAYAPIVIDPAHVGDAVGQGLFINQGYIISAQDAGQPGIGQTGLSFEGYTMEIENATTDSIDAIPVSGHSVADHQGVNIGNLGHFAADLTAASITPITINELREAFQLQRMLEKDARGGSRYTEQLRSHFGVISPDARLQRSEYLGGSTQRMYVTPVQQTSATDSTSPQGNLAAYGATSLNSGFHKSFVEHGFVIGIINARADITYAQGRNKLWDRKTRYDYYWPTLAHLGEQAVLQSEIYVKGDASDFDVFGYQERWAEYRYKPSLVTGLFNPEWPSGLPQWTLCEDFADSPTLNNIFTRDSSRRRIDRVIATPSEPQFLLDCFFDLKCAREMPVYSVPGMVDHF